MYLRNYIFILIASALSILPLRRHNDVIFFKNQDFTKGMKTTQKIQQKNIFWWGSNFDEISIFMTPSVWSIICTSNNMCEFFNEEYQLRSYEMTNTSVTIILSLEKKCWHCASIFYNLQSKWIKKLIKSTFQTCLACTFIKENI